MDLKKTIGSEDALRLVNLIENEKSITSKQTNACINKEKDHAWQRVCDAFNSSTLQAKTVEQLKSKWDNLKKNARKRSQAMRMNILKTGGGPSTYIPPNDLLDKVMGILGTSCDGLPDPFGGDKILETVDADNEPEKEIEIEIDNDLSTIFTPLKKQSKVKGKQTSDPDSIKRRNDAIADYYIAKKKVLDVKRKLYELRYKKKIEKQFGRKQIIPSDSE